MGSGKMEYKINGQGVKEEWQSKVQGKKITTMPLSEMKSLS
jgi:hypothetical protein